MEETLTTVQETKTEDLVHNKRVLDKLSNSSKTSVDVREIGLAEVKSQDGYIPAIELSVGDSVQTVFLDSETQSEEQALKTISNIPDIRSNENLFVRNNTIYSGSLSFDRSLFHLIYITLMPVLFPISLVLVAGSLLIIPFSIPFIVLSAIIAYFWVSYPEVCDVETNTNYTISTFTGYKTDELFNQQSVRVVEILPRDDNGLSIKTEDGAITWTVEGAGRVPKRDISKYRIGDNSSEITSVEKAYVEEYTGASNGLVSDCGDYVIPIRK